MKLSRAALTLALLAGMISAPGSGQSLPVDEGLWQSGQSSAAPDSANTTFAGKAEAATTIYSASHTAENRQRQHFTDNLILKPMQDQLPLLLTVKNGIDGKHGFTAFGLTIAGDQLASQADMKGANAQSFDVTGRIPAGGGPVIIEAAGDPGAIISWSLTTPAVDLQSMRPKRVRRGQELILSGSNFSSDESQDSVFINGAKAIVLSASRRSITAVVPKGARLGDGETKVVVDSIASQTLADTVQAREQPVLFSTNYWMAPPGATLTISGEHFAQDPSNNQVYFGSVPANMLGATEDTIMVTVPQWSYGHQQLNIPLSVLSDGVRSANSLPFDIGPKYLAAPPILPGDSYSAASCQPTSAPSSQACGQSGLPAGEQPPMPVPNYP